MKKLEDMTLEELWKLFPISLTPHKPEWKTYFKEEKEFIRSILFDKTIRIEHIGSTAILNIYAKNIVDILIEVKKEHYTETFKTLKSYYTLMNKQRLRSTFNKGYTVHGYAEKVYHIHLRTKEHIDELYFRDFLIEHPAVAAAYEKLKLELAKTYEFNRDGYTNAKTYFIKKYTEFAKELYKGRYT
ncbi:MAG TPA: GrpB family protein [Acholeplasma sp.]|nr:GrpB family protein [Acholeplasma sp.]